MKLYLTSLIFILSILAAPLYADEKIGVVLMHGKGGTSLPRSPIGRLADSLESAGVLVAAPDMPWSRTRKLDKSYEDSMIEIDGIVNQLKKDGATKIIVGGHSMGANAALGYGARRQGLAGIITIAPGHIPEVKSFQSKINEDWKRAREKVDAGDGDFSAAFMDMNQGKLSEIYVRPDIYLSWFSPDGPAIIPVNTANLKPKTPLFWVVGTKDSMYHRGKAYAYSKAPTHNKNAYIVIEDGGHKWAPEDGAEQILKWLKSL